MRGNYSQYIAPATASQSGKMKRMSMPATSPPADRDQSTRKPVLLIVDDDPLIVDTLSYFLEEDFSVGHATTRHEAIAWLRAQPSPPAIALVDLGLPPTPHCPDEGFALISELLAGAPQVRIVVLSGQNDSANARHARTLGAVEFVAKPALPSQLRSLLLRLLDIPGASAAESGSPLRGDSPPMQKLRAQLRQYADSPFPVLIEGESGSGKELAAAALHTQSVRQAKPYLTLNCAAIAPTLVEAALFGHAKGAFTGAIGCRAGFFEEAAEGTLLLDEIGELPLELQPKLLRVLENGDYQRVGETQVRRSQVRIVAATNRDLKQEVRTGRFRADLYHRLSVFTILVPPLRELGTDRLCLLDHFRQQIGQQFQQPGFLLSPEAERLWLAYPFPGNVRELRNIVIRLATRYPGQTILGDQLLEEFDPGKLPQVAEPAAQSSDLSHEPSPERPPLPPTPAPAPPRDDLITEARRRLLAADEPFHLDDYLLQHEAAFIEAARHLAKGNMSRAAKRLGIHRTTLYNRIEVLMRAGLLQAEPDEVNS